MKVATVADVHVHNHKRFGGEAVGSINRRCQLTLDTLSAAMDCAYEEGCTEFVIAGDLFDTSRPEPPVIAATQRVLRRYEKMQKRILVGNHDRQSHTAGDNALAPLWPVATIVERPMSVRTTEGNLFLVPHWPGDPKEWLPDVLHDLRGTEEPFLSALPALLVMHMGIKDERTPPWLQESIGAIDVGELESIMVQHRISAALAGDWHEYRCWRGDVTIAQVGALCPTGFDNPGTKGYGSVMLWEAGGTHARNESKLTREEVPGPRFVKVVTDEDRAKLDRQIRDFKDTTFFISESVEAERHATRVKEVEMLVGAKSNVMGWEALPDQSVAKAEAQHAASLARAAETFDEALTNYVSAMPLDEDVERGVIVARCKEYLKP